MKNSEMYISNTAEDKNMISEIRFYENVTSKRIISHPLMKEIKIKLDESRNNIVKWRKEFDNLNTMLDPDKNSYSEYNKIKCILDSLAERIVNETTIIEGIENCREIIMNYLIKEGVE